MFDLPEIITIWNKTGGSGYGGFTWSDPLQVTARYAYRLKKVIDSKGAEKMSSHVVYFNDTSITLDSKIYLGASNEVSPPANAKDVINFAMTPSGTPLRVAYL